jgi:hypothetical protein
MSGPRPVRRVETRVCADIVVGLMFAGLHGPATPPEPDPEPNDALLTLANRHTGREDFPPRIMSTLPRLRQRGVKLFSTMSKIQRAPGATGDQARFDASDGLRESVAASRAHDGPRVIIVVHTAATSSLGRGNSTVFRWGPRSLSLCSMNPSQFSFTHSRRGPLPSAWPHTLSARSKAIVSHCDRHSYCFFFASSIFAKSAAKVTTARRSWGSLILKNARTSWTPSSGSGEEVVASLASETLPNDRLPA